MSWPCSPRLYTKQTLLNKIKHTLENPNDTRGVYCEIYEQHGLVSQGLVYHHEHGNSADIVLLCANVDDPHGEIESIIDAGCALIVTVNGIPKRANTDEATYTASDLSPSVGPMKKWRWEFAMNAGFHSREVIRLRQERPIEFAVMIGYGLSQLPFEEATRVFTSLTLDNHEKQHLYDVFVVSGEHEGGELFPWMRDSNLRKMNKVRAAVNEMSKNATMSRRRYKTRYITNVKFS